MTLISILVEMKRTFSRSARHTADRRSIINHTITGLTSNTQELDMTSSGWDHLYTSWQMKSHSVDNTNTNSNSSVTLHIIAWDVRSSRIGSFCAQMLQDLCAKYLAFKDALPINDFVLQWHMHAKSKNNPSTDLFMMWLLQKFLSFLQSMITLPRSDAVSRMKLFQWILRILFNNICLHVLFAKTQNRC